MVKAIHGDSQQRCALLALALWLACGIGSCLAGCRREAAGGLAGAAVVPEVERAARPGRRVLFVGLDGADWQLLDEYMAGGTMPNLAALAREGRSGVLLTLHPPLSPLVWTTMMTGVSPLEHRVLDFTRLDPRSGAREPIGSSERRVPAVWNMASWAGRSVAVFGLWATYPAEAVRGLLVADRFSSFTAREAQPPPGVVFPPREEAWARRVLAETRRQTGYDAVARYLPWLRRGDYERLAAAPEPYAHPATALAQILAETRTYRALAAQWLARARPDLAIVYFQGTDEIGHLFAPYAAPRLPAVPEEEFARYSGVPRAYFAEIDGLLGELRATARELDAVLFLASDHGFQWREGRPAQLASARAATAGRWHRDEGMYLLWGPGVSASPTTGAAARPRGGVAQVCSTLLALLGLPAGRGLAEPPLPGIPGATPPGQSPGQSPGQAPGRTLDYRVWFRPGGGAAAAERTAGALPADHAALAKLRALGYVGSAEPAPPPPAGGAGAAADATRTAPSFNNEGLLLRQQGRAAESQAAFEQALARDPGLASAQWNLSELLFAGGVRRGSPGTAGAAPGAAPQVPAARGAPDAARDRSDALLLAALAGGLPDGVERTLERATAYGRSGESARSLALLDRAVAARPAEPRLWLLRGRYRMEQRRCDEAESDFGRAAGLAPADPLAHASLGLARLCRGDEGGAREEFRRSLALDPNQPEIRRFLGQGG